MPMSVFSNAPLTDLKFRTANSMMKNPKDVIVDAGKVSRAEKLQQLSDFRRAPIQTSILHQDVKLKTLKNFRGEQTVP